MLRSPPVLLALVCATAASQAAPGRPVPLSVRPDGPVPPVLFAEPPSLAGRTQQGLVTQVPLVHTSVEVDIRGMVASTTVVQVYDNRTSEPVEAIYTFPLPHGAAVHDMEARIGERIIRSDIQEKEQARRTYEAAKTEGKRAALLESERPNIFTTSIANVMPGDRVNITIRLVERLGWDAGRIRHVFPTVVAPRYIPQHVIENSRGMLAPAVPDADRLNPTYAPQGVRAGHDLAFRVRSDLGHPMAHVSSPTHALEGTRDDSGVLHLELADGAVLPDRDIVVDFTVPQDAEPRTALFLSPDDNDEAHFMMVAYPPREGAADRRPPIEWLFLSDVSGSMTGPSMDQAREALGQAFSRMRAGDRFNIVPYNHTYWSFSAESVPVTPANVEKGRAFVKGLEASGGTMMLPGLAHLMGLPRHDGVVRYIIVMTDGELGNEDEVLRSLHASLGDARLFVVTVGSAPNHFLAQKMADYGRGSFVGIANGTEIERQMNTLLNRIQSPVLSGIAVDFNGMSADSMYPSRAPDLFVGQPLVMFGRLKGTQGSVAMRGTRDGTAWIREAKLDVKEAQFHAGIRTLWARELVDEQMDTWRQSGSEDERDRLRERITADAIRYRLVTQFTSLVAVEERVVNEGGEQKRVRVPAELPFGMDRAATLGENPRGGTMDDFLDAMSVACALAGLLMLVAARRGRVNAEA